MAETVDIRELPPLPQWYCDAYRSYAPLLDLAHDIDRKGLRINRVHRQLTTGPKPTRCTEN
jgi:hypothetical protein